MIKKKITRYILLFLLACLPIVSTQNSYSSSNYNSLTALDIQKEYGAYLINTFSIDNDIIMTKLGYYESTNNWKAINNIGCIGKYQFKISTLREYGYKFTLKDFRANPEIFPEAEQDKVMVTHLKHISKLLGNTIKKYAGKQICDQVLTANKIIAGAHFAGTNGMKHFLRTGRMRSDGHTTITKYIEKI